MTIITFSGKQYSGKDTAAKILMDVLPNYKRCAMGDIIKIEYAKQNGLTYEEIDEDYVVNSIVKNVSRFMKNLKK